MRQREAEREEYCNCRCHSYCFWLRGWEYEQEEKKTFYILCLFHKLNMLGPYVGPQIKFVKKFLGETFGTSVWTPNYAKHSKMHL